jgi:6-pyruvoyltetrahydropterin/6-carboxytetrahydropterin synthase
MTTVTKEVTFDAAHLLTGYEGLCRNLHGHTYRLGVSVCAAIDDSGMVVDFKRLKALMHSEITDRFDHAYMYDETSETESELAAFLSARGLRVVALPCATTAENLARYFFERLSAHVPVSAVRVHETPTSCAEYRL